MEFWKVVHCETLNTKTVPQIKITVKLHKDANVWWEIRRYTPENEATEERININAEEMQALWYKIQTPLLKQGVWYKTSYRKLEINERATGIHINLLKNYNQNRSQQSLALLNEEKEEFEACINKCFNVLNKIIK